MHEISQNIVTPAYPEKNTCKLYCRYCKNNVCQRGMRAILLADSRLELFSTDIPPMSKIQLIGPDYTTQSCKCKIKNVACLGCGNEIGYHITQPCIQCLKSCNNGHFWMFLTDSVTAHDSNNLYGPPYSPMLENLNDVDNENNNDRYVDDIVCR
ncbi:hypothetical protein BB561_002012 [Smittium simulii]|uniref:Protein FAM72 n=1 Tax=Smittium simulii TaxID=133385 RepID=A0A2T9YS28_9FUNG|nr:hypothetical protein BB561_002012 [Smittium simulii]